MVAAVSDWTLLVFPPLILPSSNVTCFPVLWNFSKLTTVSDWGQVIMERGGLGTLWLPGHLWSFQATHISPLGLRSPGKGHRVAGKLQHPGKGPRKAAPCQIPRPNSRPKTHADQVPRCQLGGRSATFPKPTPHTSLGTRLQSRPSCLPPLALVYPQNLAL